MKVTKEVISQMVQGFNSLNREERTFENVRNLVTSFIKLTDEIPLEYSDIMLRFAGMMYNPSDKGRIGKHKEAIEHVEIAKMQGKSYIMWREFFAHKATRKDFRIDGQSFELKTGTGDWLKGSGDFNQTIKNYRNRKEWIRWDYKTAGIYIECSWAEFFDYLAAYNPKKGLETWFVENVRYNGLNDLHIWKMQEVKSSKKKLEYLQSWNG